MKVKAPRRGIRMTRADIAYQTVIYVVVILLLLVSVFPLLYVVCLSFTSEQEYYSRGPMMIIPYQPTLQAYKTIFRNTGTYVRAFVVSVQRTFAGTALTTFFSMVMGYGLSRRNIPGKRVMLFMLMVTVLYGGGLIPSFLVIKDMKLLDSFWVMVIPGLIDSWNVLVFKQFFSNLPDEIEEAAEIDGCKEMRMLFNIVMPMSLPVLAALSLFTAVGHWNSWFDALIYLPSRKDLHPLQLLLRNLFENANLGFTMTSNVQDFNTEMATSSPTSMRMALTVVGVLPILCVYPFLQKYFVKGVYVGAVKG